MMGSIVKCTPSLHVRVHACIRLFSSPHGIDESVKHCTSSPCGLPLRIQDGVLIALAFLVWLFIVVSTLSMEEKMSCMADVDA